MLKTRILSTLKFFDLQNYPLTLVELGMYLIADLSELERVLDAHWELSHVVRLADGKVGLDIILNCIQNECAEEVGEFRGFYFLTNRHAIVQERLINYAYGIKREQLIKKFVPFLRHLPFVRGIALLGSQALGQQKKSSDIDLFIVTDPQFLGIGRMVVTVYFQILGLRRHGEKITNRFCLNHYIAGTQKIEDDRNLYTAAEYGKLRPLVYTFSCNAFQEMNEDWIRIFFPNFFAPSNIGNDTRSKVQNFLEIILQNSFGKWLEKNIKAAQLRRIKQGDFIVASNRELSFHPDNRKLLLFRRFFEGK